MSELKTNQIATNDGNNVAIDNSLNLKSYTTTQRDALTSAAGDIIYNSTDSKVQAYNGSSWDNLGPTTPPMEYVIVAGGAAGLGNSQNGSYASFEGLWGGGAGGYVSSVEGENTGGGLTSDVNKRISLETGTYNITVGAGGAGGTNSFITANHGSESSIETPTKGTEVAVGGGGPRERWQTHNTNFGGCGALGTNSITGQGFAFGSNRSSSDYGYAGAGTGGADVSVSGGGSNGGAGTSTSITGSSETYGGGGGGGKHKDRGTNGSGGTGGGGGGNGSSGTANTGGGGGGAAGRSSGTATGGSGGSGIVIFRVPTTDLSSYTVTTTGSPTVTTSGDYTIYKYTATGTFVLS